MRNPGKIHAQLSMAKMMYYLGETVHISVLLENESNKTLHNVSTVLQQTVEYSVLGRRKYVVQNLALNRFDTILDPNGKDFYEAYFQIPETVPGSTPEMRKIMVAYQIYMDISLKRTFEDKKIRVFTHDIVISTRLP